MSKRPKRVSIKSETPIQLPRKWKGEEIETLHNCIMKYGHKNLDKISEQLPGRTIENIKTFLRTIHDSAGKLEKQNNTIDDWINKCDTVEGTPWRDCIQIAQVLKYLSVDGLVENHPLPERCQGIDFGQAYRLMYQAMMGYPIQPVNKPTADFVLESFGELNGEIKKQTDAIKRVESFLKDNQTKVQKEAKNESELPVTAADSTQTGKKPLRVYQRKRPMSVEPAVTPSLKIVVEEVPSGSNSAAGSSKDFSVVIEGSQANVPTTVTVPLPYENAVNKDEAELLKSRSYNPLQIPEKWLQEPLYINLLRDL